MMIDPNARYLKSHEWVKKWEGEVFLVGLSAYAVKQMGEIIYIKLSDIGIRLEKEDSFGIIESVKTVVEISTPISGRIVEANTKIPGNPDILKRDSYGVGWLIKIEAADLSELSDLMDAATYRKFLETEG